MSRDIGLAHPASDAADPPILEDEARHAQIALCPQHGSALAHLNVAGRVYFCPQMGQYWRASSKTDGLHRPLAWPKGM